MSVNRLIDEALAERAKRKNGGDPGTGSPRDLSPVRFGDVALGDGGGWRVKNFIPAEGFVGFIGPTGSLKSTALLYTGLMVAADRPCFGRKVRRGLVLYLDGEGGFGTRVRLLAARKYFNLDADLPFVLVQRPVDLRNRDGDVDAVLAVIRRYENAFEVPLAMIAVDTLARAFGGGDENSSADMGGFLMNVDKLRAEVGGTVCITHHTGKDEKLGSRGHSSLAAAFDTELRCAYADGAGSLTVTKQRDMEGGGVVGFRPERVEVGTDEDKQPIYGLVVEPSTAPVKEARKLTDRQGKTLKVLADVLARRGEPAPASNYIPAGVMVTKLDSWRELLDRRGYLDGTNPRQQWNDIKSALRDADAIGISKPHVWIVPA